ncbi:MAG: putative porin [Chromatiales bacterium]|nr:putative porin [Chromatiales bacterium]
MRTVVLVAGAMLGLLSGLGSAGARAADAASVDDVTLLRNTVANLLEAMVKQGLLSKDAATRLVADAQAKAEAETAATAGADAAAPGDVRVTYVPQVVRDDITREVQASVTEAVVADVKTAAREEGWGVPAGLPEWLGRTRLVGELRMRAEQTAFDDGNATAIPDYQRINEAGGIADLGEEQLLNSTTDQSRFQVRLTLGAIFNMTQNFTGALAFTTGNELNPVTRNQSFGLYGRSLPILLDEAYVKYQTDIDRDQHHFRLVFGRHAGLWQASDLVWYVDTRFNGATFQYAQSSPSTQYVQNSLLTQNGSGLYGQMNMPATGQARGFFTTLGAYQLQEEAFTANDKWLFGAQAGYEWQFHERVKGSFAAAWYDYKNITGRLNPPGSRQFDFTAPAFVQKGNTLFDISNDDDPLTQRWAVAADFSILHLNTMWAWLVTPRLQADFVGEWAENIGYDEAEVIARVGTAATSADLRGRTTAYRLQWRIGRPVITQPLAWRLTAGYSYAERDALLDAFTDTNFRRGGTDAQGIFLAGELGLASKSWLRLRYQGADEIDGPPLGVDVIQLDVHAQF